MIISPSGHVMFIRFEVILMFENGAPRSRKCPVAPESDIPIFFFIRNLPFFVLSTLIVMSLLSKFSGSYVACSHAL